MVADSIRMNITLPSSLAQELNNLIGPRKKSRFITEAVEQKINTIKQSQMNKVLEKGYSEGKKEGLKISKEFEIKPVDTVEIKRHRVFRRPAIGRGYAGFNFFQDNAGDEGQVLAQRLIQTEPGDIQQLAIAACGGGGGGIRTDFSCIGDKKPGVEAARAARWGDGAGGEKEVIQLWRQPGLEIAPPVRRA